MTFPPSPRWPAVGPAANRIHGMRLAFGTLLGGALLAAVLVVPLPARAADGLSLHDQWMRLIVASRPAAGYFVLENDGATARDLVGAESPACGQLMLHRSVRENGQDKMVMVKRIPVPAHGKVSFAPGGYHLMCMSPAKEMARGKNVSVTLKFADGATLKTDFPVRGATGK